MNQLIKKAFTLIELLVVIAIIGILSGLIVVAMGGMTAKATIAKAQVFSNSLRNSLMMSIVGEWKMDEGAGTVVNDAWGKVNNGTLYNFDSTASGSGDAGVDGWMSSSNCISGTCLKFDGVNDFASVGNIPISGNSSITISFWAKVISNAFGDDVLLVYGNNGTAFECAGLYYRLSEDNVKFTCWQGTTCDYSTNFPKDFNVWHHWTIKYNSSSVLIYRDGVADSKGEQTRALTFTLSNLLIGGAATATYCNVIIDEVRVFNAVLSTSQIKEQYYIGLNSLLANGNIKNVEYSERINFIGKI